MLHPTLSHPPVAKNRFQYWYKDDLVNADNTYSQKVTKYLTCMGIGFIGSIDLDKRIILKEGKLKYT